MEVQHQGVVALVTGKGWLPGLQVKALYACPHMTELLARAGFLDCRRRPYVCVLTWYSYWQGPASWFAGGSLIGVSSHGRDSEVGVGRERTREREKKRKKRERERARAISALFSCSFKDTHPIR